MTKEYFSIFFFLIPNLKNNNRKIGPKLANRLKEFLLS